MFTTFAESRQAEPSQAGPSRAELSSVRAQPRRAEPGQAGVGRAEFPIFFPSVRFQSNRFLMIKHNITGKRKCPYFGPQEETKKIIDWARAQTGWAETNRVEPTRAKSCQSAPSGIGPSRVKPKPSQAEPGQARPGPWALDHPPPELGHRCLSFARLWPTDKD